MPRMRRQRANTMITTTTLAIWCSLFTAVFVSLSVRARALRSLNTFTTQFLRDLLLTLLCSCAPSKRFSALMATSRPMNRIKSDKYMYLEPGFATL
uniref:Uncharacterized protein n=1 Tax=Arundo donax TaxID=35708 RepID=A0A0A9DFG3_ARUDO